MAIAPTKGYDCDFISEVPSHYKCPECKKVLRDPYRVSCCDEEYCRACIEEVLRDNRPCPGCGDNGDKTISTSRKTKKNVGNLRCRCSNQREGCEWKGDLQNLDDHLNENPTNENQLNGCDYTKIRCLYCQEIIPRSKMGEHQDNVCQHRPFDCQYCAHRNTYKHVTTVHLPKCPQQPVECPQGCGMSPQRQNLTAHKANECPETMLKCEIQGCEERRQRKDMKQHNEDYSAQHVQLLSQKVRELEQEAQQMKEEAKQRKKEENARHSPITLTMTNFEQLLEAQDCWRSRLFYTQEKGYAIYLSVYAAGCGIAALTRDISVYVNITRGEYDNELEWPCHLRIEVSLLNQEENGEHVTKICNIRASKDAPSYYDGWRRFMGQITARQQFLKNNSLKFRVSKIN